MASGSVYDIRTVLRSVELVWDFLDETSFLVTVWWTVCLHRMLLFSSIVFLIVMSVVGNRNRPCLGVKRES